MDEKNKGILTGRVVSLKNVGKGMLKVTLAVNTPSGKANAEKKIFSNYPKIFIPSAIDAGDIEKGVRLSIVYSVRTIKKDTDAGAIHTQILVAKKYEIDEFETTDDKNVLVLDGEVVHVFSPKEGVTLVNIKNRDNSRLAFPCITFLNGIAKLAADLQVGEMVSVKGSIQTSLKKVGDETKYSEAIIARRLDKIPE